MKILNYDSIWNKMADCDIKEQKTNNNFSYDSFSK